MSETAAKYRCNVAAVIVRADGCVLLGRKKEDSRFYHFPQGGVGHKETFEEALWREIDEETGLQRAALSICARYGGLRYQYRRKNRKRKQWAGQEQTYFLLECAAATPLTDCSKSPEFGVLEWVPYSRLHPEMFVSFKREVVTEVLNTFFPPDMKDFHSHAASLNSLHRYRFDAESSLSSYSAEDRALFAGGKNEALAQMVDLRERICAAQKKLAGVNAQHRVLVQLHDALPAEPKRRTNCLRRVAALFDPLLTRVVKPTLQPETSQALLPVLMQLYPNAGETLLTANTPYLLTDCPCDSISSFEKLMREDDVTMLKFFLLITPEQWERYASEHVPNGCYEDYLRQVDAQLRESSAVEPWFVVPAEKKWYRDYVIASIVATSLEQLVGAL